MSPAYPLNPPPDTRCDCGPALGICTHRALIPIDIREIQIATTDPAGATPDRHRRQTGDGQQHPR